MRNWIWTVLAVAGFVAGGVVVPAVRSKLADDASGTTPRNARRGADGDPHLKQSLSRIEQRLRGLEAQAAVVRAAYGNAGAASASSAPEDVGAAAEFGGAGASAQELEARREAESARLQQAPPARELLTSALRKGVVTRGEMGAFHHRLDEVPLEQRPALLREFHMALNDGTLRVEF